MPFFRPGALRFHPVAGGGHAQSLSLNAAVSRLCRAAGFRLVTGTPLHAFAHACPEPIRLLTWTLPLPAG